MGKKERKRKEEEKEGKISFCFPERFEEGLTKPELEGRGVSTSPHRG